MCAGWRGLQPTLDIFLTIPLLLLGRVDEVIE
jgi:hypothetical protein